MWGLIVFLLLQRLQEERVSLTERQDSFRQLLEEANRKYEELNSKLQENETHTQVEQRTRTQCECRQRG